MQKPQLYYKVDIQEGDMPCIHQARLLPDDQSSFSSLDSDILIKHYKTKAEKPTNRQFMSPTYKAVRPDQSPEDSRPRQRSLRKPSNSNYDLSLQNRHFEKPSSPHFDDKQRRIDQLLTENEVLRGQLQLLKSTNSNIEAQVRKGSEEIKRMRKQLNRNMHDLQQADGQEQGKAQLRVKQLESELYQLERKYERERKRCQQLEQKLKLAKSETRDYQSQQLAQIQIKKQNLNLKSTDEAYRKQEKQIRNLTSKLGQTTEQLEEQRQRYELLMEKFKQATKFPITEPIVSLRWQRNFIAAFLDMMARLGQKQKFIIPKELSEKRQTKLAWRYLKRMAAAGKFDRHFD